MKMRKKELFRMIRGLETNFGELRSQIIAHGAQIRFVSNRMDKMPNHQEELLKRIEELEQAVALLQQKMCGVESEIKMEIPPLIYTNLDDNDGLPCHEQGAITITPTEETTICMPSKGTNRTANIYIADPNI